MVVDVRVARFGGIYLDGDRLVVGEFEFWSDIHLGGEGDLLAVLDLCDVDFRPAHRDDLLLPQGVLVCLRHGVVDRFLNNRSTAETLLDHPRRNLALAKARHGYLLSNGCVRLVETRLQLIERQLDGQLDAGRAQ